MWNNLEHKISELIEENKRKTEEFEKTKEEYNKKLQLINEEQGYLKFVYYSMVQNQRLYYFNILKSGYDVRYDGLVWCVKNLIEMNTNLEYFHFPKFLNNEQIDYLISQAKSYLMENLLTLTLRILKKKQKKVLYFDQIKKHHTKTCQTMNIYRKINDDTWVEYSSDDCPDFKHFFIFLAVWIVVFLLIAVIGNLVR